MYNEIDGNFDDVAISIFKSGLLIEHGLRKSLTGKPVTSLCQLMDQIDKYKRISLRRGGIPGRTDIVITDLREISLDSQGLPTPRQLMQYSENRCIRFWRRLKMSRSSNGRTRWLETS